MALAKRSGNYINKIVDQGNLIDNPEDIKEVISEYFDLHFNKSQAIKIKEWRCNLRSLNMNGSNLLERPFSKEEVWNVISNYDGNKALGQDGYNMHFFKNYWSLIKEDVMRIFEQFFESGYFTKG